jgi:hypothetical protein
LISNAHRFRFHSRPSVIKQKEENKERKDWIELEVGVGVGIKRILFQFFTIFGIARNISEYGAKKVVINLF